jgi:hypothetical protein
MKSFIIAFAMPKSISFGDLLTSTKLAGFRSECTIHFLYVSYCLLQAFIKTKKEKVENVLECLKFRIQILCFSILIMQVPDLANNK